MNKIMNKTVPKGRYLRILHVHGDLPAAGTAGPAGGVRTAGHPQPWPKVGWVLMASMDISLIPCMPGIILPPSWGAYIRTSAFCAILG